MAPSLRVDPVPYLLRSGPAVGYFTRRDLLGDPVGSLEEVWRLPEIARLLRGQNADGSWGRPGGYPPHHRPTVETFKHLRLLVGRYELDHEGPGPDPFPYRARPKMPISKQLSAY